MATVGTQLPAPESTWQRYDNNHSYIKYAGTWGNFTDETCYNSTLTGSSVYGDTIKFGFYGTKLRIISTMANNQDYSVGITIDGVGYSYSTAYTSGALTSQVLLYEKTGLTLGLHTISITKGHNDTSYFGLDCIDIDSTGYLTLIGAQLLTPESTWQRYDDHNILMAFKGTWYDYSGDASNQNGGSTYYANAQGNKIIFSFYGTKIRLVNYCMPSHSVEKITIDGISANYNSYTATITPHYVVYEKIGLPLGLHTVVITKTSISDTYAIALDSIDIDSTGYLATYKSYLIKSGSSYYSMRTDYYDAVTNHSFTALALAGGTTPNVTDIETFGFGDASNLITSMTKGSDTFRPLDKLSSGFSVVMYK